MNKKTAVTVTVILAIINGFMWFTSSNIVRMIAIKKVILLGSYSVGRLTGNITVLLVSLIVLYVVWSRDRQQLKKRCFRLCAFFMVMIPTVIVMDVTLRFIAQTRYVGTNEFYHRPPNYSYKGTYKDIPLQKRSYPRVEKGYPDYPHVMTVDGRGFRNNTTLEKSDIVLVGDSFTEGSEVSDEQVWGQLLGKKIDQTVCNLGMAGSDPFNYLVTLKKFGVKLQPKVVICMVYEGNDFRRTQLFSGYSETISLSKRIKTTFKRSPIRNYIKHFLIAYGEDVGKNREVSNKGAIDWLPLEFPKGSNVFHSFPVKRAMEHYKTYEQISKSTVTKNVLAAIKKMSALSKENNARYIVVFAPTKPHVLLPVAKETIPIEKFHDFCMLYKRRMRKKLPSNEFFKKMLECLEVKEKLVKEFCAANKLEFISLTKILQQKTTEGRQMYFTYDQHWTPEGHVVVANYLQKQAFAK